MEVKNFISPLRKLVVFFRKSRDRWKEKCQEAKRLCKKLSNQLRAVESSRQQWRELAQQYQSQVKELERALETNKNASV